MTSSYSTKKQQMEQKTKTDSLYGQIHNKHPLQ